MPSNNAPSRKKSRKTLILVLLLFVFPAMLASFMFFTGWRPSTTINHGQLIRPAKPISDVEFKSLDGKVVKLSELRGKWTMVYFDASTCPDECVKQLFFMRQTHVSQGKNQDRVQRIFVLTDKLAVEALKTKLTEYTGMQVLMGEQSVLNGLRQEFGIDAGVVSPQRNIYLLDPQGNLMMQYLPDSEPVGIRKDLERLLKYSYE